MWTIVTKPRLIKAYMIVKIINVNVLEAHMLWTYGWMVLIREKQWSYSTKYICVPSPSKKGVRTSKLTQKYITVYF